MPRILVECQGPEDDTSALPPPRWMHVDAAWPVERLARLAGAQLVFNPARAGVLRMNEIVLRCFSEDDRAVLVCAQTSACDLGISQCEPCDDGDDTTAATGVPAAIDGHVAAVVSFSWRRETLAAYFAAGPGASTRSAAVAVAVAGDVLRLRILLMCCDGGDGASEPVHRLTVLVDRDASAQVYALSLHALCAPPPLNLHAADHRATFSTATLPAAHPLVAALRATDAPPTLTALVRVSPASDAARLGALCECC